MSTKFSRILEKRDSRRLLTGSPSDLRSLLLWEWVGDPGQDCTAMLFNCSVLMRCTGHQDQRTAQTLDTAQRTLWTGYQCPDDPDSKRDGAANGTNLLDCSKEEHRQLRHLSDDHHLSTFSPSNHLYH